MAKKETTTKSSKSSKPKKRPSFSPPTPPSPIIPPDPEPELIDDSDLVENTPEDTPANPELKSPTEIEAPTPPAKFITRKGPDREDSFHKVINANADTESSDTSSEEDSESSPSDLPNDDTIEEVDLDSALELDEPSPPPSTPKLSKSKSKKPSMFGKFIKLLFIVLLLGFGFSGWYLYLTSNPDAMNQLSPTTQISPTTAPEPTQAPPTPTPVDRSTITIQILNGAGISGAAGTTAETLEGLGYTIADTGNADASNYETTEIYLSPDFPESLESFFLEELEEEYGSASVSGEIDETGLDYNTRIILGADWFESDTDTENVDN